MNRTAHNTQPDTKPEHGTMESYVTGFILSLVFTLIPYFLVVNRTLTGKALLAAILGFAFLQLIVQLVFFLHLGREKGPRWNLGFLVSTFGAILVVVGGSLWIIGHLHDNMMNPADMKHRLIDDEAIHQLGGVKTGSCVGVHTNHRVTLIHSTAIPSHVDARLCDTLTITNQDDATRDIAFGTHPDHGVYAGQTGYNLYKGKSWTLTLSQTGTYQFHDHLRNEAAGEFTVAP